MTLVRLYLTNMQTNNEQATTYECRLASPTKWLGKVSDFDIFCFLVKHYIIIRKGMQNIYEHIKYTNQGYTILILLILTSHDLNPLSI